MKNILIKYSGVITLVVMYIFMIFFFLFQDSCNEKSFVYVQENDAVVKYELINEKREINEKIYISIGDATNIFDNLYYDKLTYTAILTKEKSVLKYKLNEKKQYLNFIENGEAEDFLIKVDGEVYVMMDYLAQITDNMMLNNSNESWLLKKDIVKGILNNQRCIFIQDIKYPKKLNDIVSCDEIYVLSFDENYANIVYKQGGCYKLGYINNTNITFDKELFVELKDENLSDKKIHMIFSTSETIDNIAQYDYIIKPMYKLSNAFGDIKIETTSKLTNLLPVYDNGYEASNYNNNISLYMLTNDLARANNIQNIMKEVVNSEYDGVIVGFRDLLPSAIPYYIQYLKELTSYAHSLDKMVGVYFENEYTMLSEVQNIDMVIIKCYSVLNETSNLPLANCTVNMVEEKVTKLLNLGIKSSKIIVEISTCSVLWTLKDNLVISKEIYSMKLAQEFVSKNSLKINKNENNEKYVEVTKGQLCYLMYLEDQYSLTQKLELINSLNINGSNLYKNEYIIDGIFEIN